MEVANDKLAVGLKQKEGDCHRNGSAKVDECELRARFFVDSRLAAQPVVRRF